MFYLSLLLRILYCPILFPLIYSIFISNSILFYHLPSYFLFFSLIFSYFLIFSLIFLDQKVGDRDRNIEDDDDEDDEDYVDGEEEDDDDEDDGK